jgi:membrane-associated protease RseP (regulator of RpoE activity)
LSAFGTVLFAAAILFSIGLHELGHLAAAKRFGIKVEQYFIGFGPKIWSFRKGETEYGVKAIPLGGFVRIAGMNPFEEIAPEDAGRVFKAKKPWQRAIVLAMGSFTHFVLALAIIAIILSAVGQADTKHPTTRIDSLTTELDGKPSPAAVAGIKTGDVVLEVDGAPIQTWQQAVDVIHDRAGKTIPIVVRRGAQRLTLRVPVATHKPDGTKVGFVGIGPEFPVIHRGALSAVGDAGRQVGSGAWASLVALKDLFSPHTIARLFSVAVGNTKRSATDPATVVGLGGEAGHLARTGDYAGLFYLIAGFNVFIGIANLLPLPPLDGGHLAVLAYEKVTKRDVDMRRLIPLTATVISIFGSLFVLLLYLDIVRPLPAIPG